QLALGRPDRTGPGRRPVDEHTVGERHAAESDLFLCHGERKRSDSAAWRSPTDRKSTRLNSSHSQISYAVFCLKKKKKKNKQNKNKKKNKDKKKQLINIRNLKKNISYIKYREVLVNTTLDK